MGDLGICPYFVCIEIQQRIVKPEVTQPDKDGNRFPGSQYCTLNHKISLF